MAESKKTEDASKVEKGTPGRKSGGTEVRKRKNANKTPKKSAKKPQHKNRKPKEEKVQLTEFQKTCEEFKKFAIKNIRRHPVAFLITASSISLLVALYFVGESLDMTGKNQKLPKITEKVSMELSHGGRNMGTVTIGLFGKRCPLTVMNFVMLATHEKGYGYQNSTFHRVIPKKAIMGGDIVNGDGTSGKSALDESFEFEYVKIRNADEGLVGILPIKDNEDSKKSSQFYITLGPFTAMDGLATVFGKVIEGMGIIRELGKVELDDQWAPFFDIKIESLTHDIIV